MILRFIFLILITVSLTGCFDIIESFTINENGSGVYSQKLDFSDEYKKMLGQIRKIESMIPPNKKKHQAVNIDSIVFYKSRIDTLTGLTVFEKETLMSSFARLVSSEDSGVVYVEVFYPFKGISAFKQLHQILKKENDRYGLLENIATQLFYNGVYAPPNFVEIGQKKPFIQFPFSNFFYTLSSNSLKRVTENHEDNKEALEIENGFFKGFNSRKINYKTLVNLPTLNKKITGEYSLISEDKKKITFLKQIDFRSTYENSNFNFTIWKYLFMVKPDSPKSFLY